VAKQVLLNCYVEINAVDRTANVAKVELDDQFEEKETTTFASGGAKEVIGGLESGTIGITFKNDYAGGALDSAMWALRRSVVAFKVRPEKDVIVSSANPQYSGSMLINQWKPIAGAVGDVAEVDVSFPMSGVMVRSTTT
jgi:hypothetical protein